MPNFALRRKFDGKLLSHSAATRRRVPMTWAEFDDMMPGEPYIPFIWPSLKGAQSALKMWLRGGWARHHIDYRTRKWTPDPKPDRAEFPVEVVQITYTVLPETDKVVLEQQERARNSVL